ncbi:MAG: hypothetical protein PHR25_04175 [Clostridia bacterium]|nr:hypothetical protein [Clostridia bacterium]MDD4375960.1 hypothetical protein [Clostridia bacterium]
MQKVITKTITQGEITRKLQAMLTNHGERPHHVLHVIVYFSGNIIEEDEFVIYANEPVSKIVGKIEKLKTRKVYPNIKIKKIKNIDGIWRLELSI